MNTNQAIKIHYRTAMHILIYTVILILLIMLITKLSVSENSLKGNLKIEMKSPGNNLTKR
jgi:hypothetical protein